MTAEIAATLGNLPAEPNSFVGRERDIAELAQLLGDVRALTLCGPGGIGKTRLALRLACEIVPGFPDGAWLVELADTTDPALLPRRIATALGVREEPDRPLAETLADALRPRALLLILDTCEHVVDACAALVHQLLAGCPGLRLIATSREPLRVRGETVWRVPPLAVPDGPAAGDPAGHEAIRLFVERAAAARPGFTLADANSSAVASLCRTLDGMPLAIELAAARVRALSIEQIAGRLGDRFRLLASGDRTAPPRQQTLRAAVDWSYELLTGPEQTLLRRLSVFTGWNLEMAEQVCADEVIPAGQVLDLLVALIDKSLVTLDGELDGDARYRLLDTIREYAADRLAASGEQEAVRLRHRDYLVNLVDSVVARAFVRGDPPWPVRVALYRRVEAERGNFDAALGLCLERGEAAEGLHLCSALRSPWIAYGDVGEGAGWFDRFFALAGPPVPGQLRARALMHRAELAFEQQDYPMTARSAQAGLELCQAGGGQGAAIGLRMLALTTMRAGRADEALAQAGAAAAAAARDGDDWEEGLALSVRATVLARMGQLTEAERAYQVALDVLRDNNGWGVAQALSGSGGVARARGDHAAAMRHFTAALELYRAIGARPEIARCLAGIGWLAMAQGDTALAAGSLAESLRLSLATGQRLAIARGLQAAAALAAARGELPKAARLAGAELALLEAIGHRRSRSARSQADQLLGLARRELGEPAVSALLAAGRALSPYAAVREATDAAAPDLAPAGPESPPWPARPGTARSGTARPGTARPGLPGASVLTAREREIAALIARGLSNRGIAGELVISPATAARHVANIFTKLGLRSRAQVAAWVAERQAREQG
ncbi:MAG TPA: LuxR C-terminal-related transcriptional regulator [Streptosporangiaceae bacterium]|jgi:predicted ATPase/DNA-binding CsgD family transcriptional regulator